MIKAVKRLWNYILTNKHPVADFIWQLDHDIDVLNAMIIEATKEIENEHSSSTIYGHKQR